MDRRILGINGIYDQRSFKKLTDQDIQFFIFDQRTKSPNFIQNYVLIDLIKSLGGRNINIVLRFDNDKPFMINHAIDSILKETTLTTANIELWFDHEFNPWIEDARIPFKIYYNDQTNIKSFVNKSHLKGLVFNAFDFNSMGMQKMQNKMFNMLQALGKNSFEHTLELLPMDSFPASLVDYLDLQSFSLKIDSDLEICYRNIDLDKLLKSIKFIKRELNTQQF